MLAGADHAGSAESTACPQDLVELLVPDPSGMAPIGDEEEFAAVLAAMVADKAPRLFAVAQEYGERVDGRIAAWGMAFDDHALVLPLDCTGYLSLPAPEDALSRFSLGDRIRDRLVWHDPDAATPAKDNEAD